MKKITVFTPTYNRIQTLPKLYDSLCHQTSDDFVWLIVDDGSTDGTGALVNQWLTDEKNKVDIRYYYQENRGKSMAHNRGVEFCDTELFCCVDSDDYLSDDAIESIVDCWSTATRENVGILAARDFGTGNSLIERTNGKRICATLADAYEKYGLHGDTMLIYRTNLLRKYPFPYFEGEKFVTEKYLYDLLDECGTLIFLNKVLYVGTYRTDGYTQNYKALLYRNPRGYMAYMENVLKRDRLPHQKFLDSIRYMDMAFVAKEKRKIRGSVYPFYVALAYVPGYLLYAMRYKNFKCENAATRNKTGERKKIFIYSHGMELGGAETALLGLLEAIDPNKYDVDLFLMHHSGELFEFIPDYINILPEIPEYSSLAVPMKEVIKKKQFRVLWGRVLGKYLADRKQREHEQGRDDMTVLEYSHKYTLKYMPQINDEEYDLAISFLTPHYFVANRVQANKRIAWIHTDYSAIALDRESEVLMWKQYDRIAAISETVADGFLKVFPELEDKVFLMENILPEKYIQARVEEKDVSEEMPEDGCIRFLSIGRYSNPKNFDNVPQICRYLLDMGHHVRWYMIGYGSELELKKIEDARVRYHVENNVVLLGKKDNPYPYIKACDYYIQPSRYEGKSIAVREAQLLGKVVIITNFATAQGQLRDGYDGVIVPMDNEKCAEGIAEVISNNDLCNTILANVTQGDYTNSEEIYKLYEFGE